MRTNIENLLGLAHRAGKLTLGRYAVIKAIRQQRAKLIILAHDASEKMISEIRTVDPQCKMIRYGEKDDLGNILGRAELAVIAICDQQFAQGILKIMLKVNSGGVDE